LIKDQETSPLSEDFVDFVEPKKHKNKAPRYFRKLMVTIKRRKK
jgi:hypothetical protein